MYLFIFSLSCCSSCMHFWRTPILGYKCCRLQQQRLLLQKCVFARLDVVEFPHWGDRPPFPLGVEHGRENVELGLSVEPAVRGSTGAGFLAGGQVHTENWEEILSSHHFSENASRRFQFARGHE